MIERRTKRSIDGVEAGIERPQARLGTSDVRSIMEQELEFRPVFEQVTAAACEDLFSRYGVTVRRADERDDPVNPEFFLCSVIGFTGRDVRGTLVLALTEELSGLSNPVAGANRGATTNQVIQRDWVGELSNQLLGQIKIELLRRGVEIYMNLPTVLQGQHLAPLPRRELKPLKFTLGNGAAAVWIELEPREGFKIEPAASVAEGPAPGDTLLFD
jgi:CheY-specific phosphatase CheX